MFRKKMAKNKKLKKQQIKNISNMELHYEENFVILSVNPKLYPLDVVYSAAYTFLDRAYLILDGDPDEEILVELRPKKKDQDIEALGRDFNNELLNYAVYKTQSDKSRPIKEAIVSRALETNMVGNVEREERIEEQSVSDLYSDEDLSFIDDPLGIAKPWEETHGKELEQQKEDE